MDTEGIDQLGLWCMNGPDDNGDPIGFPCHVDSCPRIYDELLEWKLALAEEARGRRFMPSSSVESMSAAAARPTRLESIDDVGAEGEDDEDREPPVSYDDDDDDEPVQID